jgi:hypothetical protein
VHGAQISHGVDIGKVLPQLDRDLLEPRRVFEEGYPPLGMLASGSLVVEVWRGYREAPENSVFDDARLLTLHKGTREAQRARLQLAGEIG